MIYALRPTQNDILHYGVDHLHAKNGRGSGRYAWGSGKNPGNKRSLKRNAKKNKMIEKYQGHKLDSLQAKKNAYELYRMSNESQKGDASYFKDAESLRKSGDETLNYSKIEEAKANKLYDKIMKKYGDDILSESNKISEHNAKEAMDSFNAGIKKLETEIEFERQSANKSRNETLLNRAKKFDQFDINFLEAVQNDSEYDNKSYLLKEYKKYLNNPEEYWRNRGQLKGVNK